MRMSNKEILRIGCLLGVLIKIFPRNQAFLNTDSGQLDTKEDCRIKNRRCLGMCCFNFPERPTIYYRHGQSPMCKVWKTQPICQGHFWLRAKRNPLLLLLFDLGIPECMFTHFKNSLLDKIVMLHSSTTQWFLTCSLCMFCIVSNFLQPITY